MTYCHKKKNPKRINDKKGRYVADIYWTEESGAFCEELDMVVVEQFSDRVYMTPDTAFQVFEFSRGAQGSPVCTHRGPKPAESEGVQAEAKRSPKGCLDAAANAGHCKVTLTSWKNMMLPHDSDIWRIEGGECAWRFVPNTSESGGTSCA